MYTHTCIQYIYIHTYIYIHHNDNVTTTTTTNDNNNGDNDNTNDNNHNSNNDNNETNNYDAMPYYIISYHAASPPGRLRLRPLGGQPDAAVPPGPGGRADHERLLRQRRRHQVRQGARRQPHRHGQGAAAPDGHSINSY